METKGFFVKINMYPSKCGGFVSERNNRFDYVVV